MHGDGVEEREQYVTHPDSQRSALLFRGETDKYMHHVAAYNRQIVPV